MRIFKIEPKNLNRKRIFSIQVLNEPRKFRLFTNWNGKLKTEREFFQFKFWTNRESSDFLHIETENQNRKWFFQFKFWTNRESSDFLQIERDYWNGKPKKKNCKKPTKIPDFYNHWTDWKIKRLNLELKTEIELKATNYNTVYNLCSNRI